ncbi:MAG: tRNA pseudouridine(38-40) synthase TruA [Candidatus Eremiobacteraeota bacterium]|nr:tRNA pseudouridine(38-40) synthase TruA [Candidatus Eremiobacteraeota bacterium]
MRNLRLIIEYDGTYFNGFQKQTLPGMVTVQNRLEEALAKILNEPVKTVVAGRTDTGVHAVAQVVSFRTSSPRPAGEIKHALNALLHGAMAIHSVDEMPLRFHARFSARSRLYHYYILNREEPPSLGRSYLHHVRHPLDIEKMREASRFLEGEHDFTAFSTSIKEVKTAIRKIEHINILQGTHCAEKGKILYVPFEALYREGIILVELKANSFLRSMVRMIVAVLVRAGLGKMEPREVSRILAEKNPGLIHTPAPPEGLFLVKVDYQEGDSGSLRENNVP